jgi:hypothetical protein
MNLAAFLPLSRHFCRIAALLLRPPGASNRHFCRKSRFAESAEKVPETRFRVLGDLANPLICKGIGDKGRLPIEPNG